MSKTGGLVFCKYCMKHQPVGYQCCTTAKAEIAELKDENSKFRAIFESQTLDDIRTDAIEKMVSLDGVGQWLDSPTRILIRDYIKQLERGEV